MCWRTSQLVHRSAAQVVCCFLLRFLPNICSEVVFPWDFHNFAKFSCAAFGSQRLKKDEWTLSRCQLAPVMHGFYCELLAHVSREFLEVCLFVLFLFASSKGHENRFRVSDGRNTSLTSGTSKKLLRSSQAYQFWLSMPITIQHETTIHDHIESYHSESAHYSAHYFESAHLSLL